MALENISHSEELKKDTTLPIRKILAEAEDPEVLRKAVDDTSSVSGGLWLSYLFVLFYLGIAAGDVTHADLLLQNTVKLPFLNVELPMLAFFALAPLLFVITHAYTLVNLVMLADRVRQFGELRDHIGNLTSDAEALNIRAALTRQLPSNIFVQFLGRSSETRSGALGLILEAILWITLVVAPVALLLLIEIQFLPYHDLWITWTSRIALILDLGLIWWLWRNILQSRTFGNQRFFLRSFAKTTVAAILSASAIVFACVIATIPGEWQEDHFVAKSALAMIRKWGFHGDVNPTTRRRKSLFSNTLVLPDFNIYEAFKIDEPQKVEWKPYLIELRGRDLNRTLPIGTQAIENA
jgi:hypothetical protein